MKLVFLDTETTGLADDCDVWEIGLIARLPVDPTEYGLPEDTTVHKDVAHSWLIRPDLTTAEPTGLRIGRYYQRMRGFGLSGSQPGWGRLTSPGAPPDDRLPRRAENIAADVAQLLDGATIVGAVPNFDTEHLGRWLRRHNQCGTWRHHLIDVETLAAGALRMPPPWNLDVLLDRYGLKYDEDERHTALGDARMVRDLYDAVYGTAPQAVA